MFAPNFVLFALIRLFLRMGKKNATRGKEWEWEIERERKEKQEKIGRDKEEQGECEGGVGREWEKEREREGESKVIKCLWAGNPYWRGRLSTVDLLPLTTLDQVLLIVWMLFTFYKTS
jgi:hypothetical protein